MKQISALLFSICLCITSFAQQQESELNRTEKTGQKSQSHEDAVKALQKLKISGYIQTQYQWGEQDASLDVGNINTDPEESFNRIGIRRGRIKLTYDEGVLGGVFQLDLTEKGVRIKDVYLGIRDPWARIGVLKAGIFNRPFGNEISYSSSRRESPERSTIFQTLFPEGRDLGASITLQASKVSPWNFLKLEAGLFAGNGIKQETDNRKDFIGHLSATKIIHKDIKIGGGVSYYNGGVFQGNENVYTMAGNGFVLNNNPGNKGKSAKREYLGFDAQFSLTSPLGTTQIRGEYLIGMQPGGALDSKSPNASVTPTTDTYLRNFNGGYIIFIQDLGKLPLSAVLKYDSYDPNTKIAGNNIGQNGTTLADLSQNTFGFGMLWRANKSIRLQAFYEINNNETTASLPGFTDDTNNDVFTLRLQYKF